MHRGFTLFFAMLVGSLTLAVGLAIYDITVRELDLSAAVAQSQYAIYAADAGIECALYWDTKCTIGACSSNGAVNSVFATSSTDVARANSVTGAICNGQDIRTAGSGWTITPGTPTTTTQFTIFVSAQSQVNATTTCARVIVSKAGNPSVTSVISRGFNTCSVGPLQLERSLQISY